MRITTKGRYALRAIRHLVKTGDQKPTSIKKIAEEEDLSAEFLEQIFFRLKNAGVIRSVRGPGGGFMLNRPAAEISMRHIFDAVGEGVSLAPCVSCKEVPAPECCPRLDICPVHSVWNALAGQVAEIFDSYTLDKISDIIKVPKKAEKARS